MQMNVASAEWTCFYKGDKDANPGPPPPGVERPAPLGIAVLPIEASEVVSQ